MSNAAQRVATVLSHPKIGVEYARWVFQQTVLGQEPVRNVYGIMLGGFNGFSEYHTVAGGITADEMQFIRNYPFDSGAIVDIGANLGLFSLLVAKRFDERPIYAIEPNPSTHQSLSRNVARNGRGYIICSQCAIADHDGAVRFASREGARANASIVADITPEADTVSVPCSTLDSYCRRNHIERIAILKVDVEGFETIVFRGAASVLGSSQPPVIYFEVCPALTCLAGFDPLEPSTILIDYGYKLNRIGNGGKLEPVTADVAAQVERVENWVAVPPS